MQLAFGKPNLFYVVKGYTRKGASHFAMKEFSKATDAYNKALELDKDNKVSNKPVWFCYNIRNKQIYFVIA